MEKCSYGKSLLEKCSYDDFGMDIFTVAISPRRDERLRPLRGIPAAPPKSLAFGRGRRHICYVKSNIFVDLFRAGRSGPSTGGRGGLRLGHGEDVPRLLALREGRLQRVRELIAPGAAAPARLYSGKRP